MIHLGKLFIRSSWVKQNKNDLQPGERRTTKWAPFLLMFWGFLILIVLAAAQEAGATFFDTFGVNARGMALGNAMVAMAEGWESVYYNPAGLALGHDIEVSLGLFYATPNLKVKYKGAEEEKEKKFLLNTAPLDNLSGPVLGLLLPIQKCTSKKLPMPWALGVGLFIPRQALVTTRMVEQGFPFDVIFNESNNTLSLYTGLATRITPAFYFGVGLAAQLVTPTESQISYITPQSSGISTSAQNAVDLEARFGMPSFLVGLLIRPAERIRIGFVYRGETKVESEWDTQVKSQFVLRFGSQPGSYISIYDEQHLSMHYVTGFTPETFSFGASYKIIERLRLSGEFTWYRWSQYGGPHDTGLQFEFNDIWVPRLGLLFRLTRQLDLRFGFYYEPTPVTNQPQGFYPIGNDRYVYSTGIGYTFADPWGILTKPLSVDAYFQYHMLTEEDFDRAGPATPFTRDTDLSSTGYLVNIGFNLTLHF